jgi:hypothetical protein
MIYLLSQLGVTVVLFGGLWIGWRRWVNPYRIGLDAQGSGMLTLAVLAVAGGLIGSPFWWVDYPGSFSWALPPLAARLLASAGFAFAVAGSYALEQKQQQLIRSYIVMLAVYLAPLVVAILLLHLNRFDWGAPITYGFFVVAGGMAAAAIWHLARGTALGPEFSGLPEQPLPSMLRAWLWLVAIITGLWGLAMFLYPQGPFPQIWVWPQDPLTSRLIASMLLTLSTGALLGLRSAAQARMSLWMFVTYGVGAALACFWNMSAGIPVPMTYAVAFCVLGLISITILLFRFRCVAPNTGRSQQGAV